MFVLFFIFLNQGIPENIATEKLEDKLQGIQTLQTSNINLQTLQMTISIGNVVCTNKCAEDIKQTDKKINRWIYM